jgi:hypothetical protein
MHTSPRQWFTIGVAIYFAALLGTALMPRPMPLFVAMRLHGLKGYVAFTSKPVKLMSLP